VLLLWVVGVGVPRVCPHAFVVLAGIVVLLERLVVARLPDGQVGARLLCGKETSIMLAGRAGPREAGPHGQSAPSTQSMASPLFALPRIICPVPGRAIDARMASPRGDRLGAGTPIDGWAPIINARSVFQITVSLSFYDNLAATDLCTVLHNQEVSAGADTIQVKLAKSRR